MTSDDRLSKLSRLAIGQALSGSVIALPWIAEMVENEQLMIEARCITGKSEEEIRAAAAQSPLCFRDFVQWLKTGHTL